MRGGMERSKPPASLLRAKQKLAFIKMLQHDKKSDYDTTLDYDAMTKVMQLLSDNQFTSPAYKSPDESVEYPENDYVRFLLRNIQGPYSHVRMPTDWNRHHNQQEVEEEWSDRGKMDTEGVGADLWITGDVPRHHNGIAKHPDDFHDYNAFHHVYKDRIKGDKDASGFYEDGYDEYGFDIYGFNKIGMDKHGNDKTGNRWYDSDFDGVGRDVSGYDEGGFNMYGYNKEGYDIGGFNEEGYNKEGYDIGGFNEEGYNKEGYNEDGYNRDGYNIDGYNEDGYNRDGYDIDGYNEEGNNKDGYDIDGYNEEGIHWDELNESIYTWGDNDT
jgi:hypothetical protein